jgi:pilus assembly protein Flp/PilA
MKIKIQNAVRAFLKKEDGVTMVEYALLAALIAGVSVGVITTMGTSIQALFQKIADKLK